jgi:putative ATPase
MDLAKKDAETLYYDDVPGHLKNAPYGNPEEKEQSKGYKYPHNYGGYCEQDYLPEKIKDHKYYFPSNNGEEEKVQEFIKKHLNFDKK